jgi:hypothetical protein
MFKGRGVGVDGSGYFVVLIVIDTGTAAEEVF